MSIPPSVPKNIDEHEMQRLIRRNLAIIVFSRVFFLITRVFIPPLVLSFIGLAEYGIWTICFTLITYLNVGTFGITNVYIKYVAEYYGKNETNKINGLLSTGIILTSIISLNALLIFWFLLDLIVEQLFQIPKPLHQTAFILFFATACLFVLQEILGAFQRTLNGLQKMAESMAVGIIGSLLESVFIVIFLFLGLGVYGLLYALIIRLAYSNIVYIIMSYEALPGLSIRFKHFSKNYFKVFYRFGGILQVSGMITLFLSSVDKLLTSTWLNMQATALIGLGSRLPGVATSVTYSMNAVYLPATSYLYSQQRWDEMRKIYLQGSHLIGLTTGFMMGFIAAFSSPLIVTWLGTQQEYQISATVMVIYALSQHLQVITAPGGAFSKGIDKPENNLIYSSVNLVLTGITTLTILSFFGITILTIALSVSVATIASSLIYITYNNHFVIGISQLTFARKVYLPSFLPYGIAYLLSGILTPWKAMEDRWYTLGFTLVSGVIYVILTAIIFYWVVYNHQERRDLRQRTHQGLKKVSNFLGKKFSHFLNKKV